MTEQERAHHRNVLDNPHARIGWLESQLVGWLEAIEAKSPVILGVEREITENYFEEHYGGVSEWKRKMGRLPAAEIIYRCGWCGTPVQHDGEMLPEILTPQDANSYLRDHAGAKVKLVNGACCPFGDPRDAYAHSYGEASND